MSRRRELVSVLTAGVLFALPSAAYADAGVPMLAIAWPGMGVALLPVIALEAFVLLRMLCLPARRAILVSAVANAVSTLLGIPMTWVALVAMQMLTPGGGGTGPDIGTLTGKVFAVTVQAPWLIPYDSELYWMMPAAALVLLVPFFFASWGIEYLVARRMLRDIGPPAVNKAVFVANLISYVLLALIVLAALGSALYRHAAV